MSNLSFLDWLIVGQISLIWIYMAYKTGRWVTKNIIKYIVRRTPKGRAEMAINELLAIYEVKGDQTVTVNLSGGWYVKMGNIIREEVSHDA